VLALSILTARHNTAYLIYMGKSYPFE